MACTFREILAVIQILLNNAKPNAKQQTNVDQQNGEKNVGGWSTAGVARCFDAFHGIAITIITVSGGNFFMLIGR